MAGILAPLGPRRLGKTSSCFSSGALAERRHLQGTTPPASTCPILKEVHERVGVPCGRTSTTAFSLRRAWIWRPARSGRARARAVAGTPSSQRSARCAERRDGGDLRTERAHWDSRFRSFFIVFDYDAAGILDRTYFCFFTGRSTSGPTGRTGGVQVRALEPGGLLLARAHIKGIGGHGCAARSSRPDDLGPRCSPTSRLREIHARHR